MLNIIIVVVLILILFIFTKKDVKQCDEVKEDLRKLFTEHAVYTKFAVNSFFDNSTDLNVVINRLLKNQEDIGMFLSKMIGVENGKIVSEKLKEHILLATECLHSLKESEEKLNESIKNLFKNAEEIGSFLSSLNPKLLSKEKAIQEFKTHNQHVLDFAVARFKKEHEKEIQIYDVYYNHMLMLSDVIYNILPKN